MLKIARMNHEPTEFVSNSDTHHLRRWRSSRYRTWVCHQPSQPKVDPQGSYGMKRVAQ